MKTVEPRQRTAAARRVLRYAAELGVVFVGVWLSLLAEDWRQHRVDAEAEQSSLARMTEDLASDLADLSVNLSRAEPGVTYGRWLLGRAAAVDIHPDSLARALSAIQFCSMFVENTAEYEALRNSGQLGIISDAAVRRRIVALYESRRLIRSLHDRDCQLIEATFDLIAPHVVLAEPPPAALGETASDGFMDSSRPRVASVPGRVDLLHDRAFLSHLAELVAGRRFLVDQINSQVHDTQALREELLARLDAPATGRK